MATITKIQPTHLIDEGRAIANQNDTNLNNDITTLNNTLNTHNHNSLYYTKEETQSLVINNTRFIITVGIPSSTGQSYAKIGGLSLSNTMGIPSPLDCQLIAVQLYSSGEAKIWGEGSFTPVSFTYLTPDSISVRYSEIVDANNVNQAYIEILKNGAVALQLAWREASASTRTDKIINLIFKRV